MIAKIIAIGSELLNGSVAESNSRFLISALKSIGLSVAAVKLIRDDVASIVRALECESDADILLITGGLGPTHDDVTVKAAANYFRCELVFSDIAMQRMQMLFKNRGAAAVLNNTNRRQAMVPAKAELIPNPIGTAQGLKFKKGKTVFYFMPGVPVEMEQMMTGCILQELRQFSHKANISTTIHTTSVPESILFRRIEHWIEKNQDIEVSILPHFPEVDIVISADLSKGGKPGFEKALSELTEILGDDRYGDNQDSLELVVARQLLSNHLTIATAESCTGGLIANRLTNISGSSAYFRQGMICYSNQSKTEQLGVPDRILADFGAVSRQTALEMAVSIRRIAQTDVGLSTTGIAGPTGGSAGKPVGTVYIGLNIGDHQVVFHFRYNRDRLSNKIYFSQMALNQLRLQLKRVYG
ncbi:MAG: CinA family nicotinamide mononucleotide deamidase-related protein [Fidelibacterota bacterium]